MAGDTRAAKPRTSERKDLRRQLSYDGAVQGERTQPLPVAVPSIPVQNDAQLNYDGAVQGEMTQPLSVAVPSISEQDDGAVQGEETHPCR